MFTDYVLNGRGYGDVGSVVANELNFQPNLRRPFIDSKDRACVMVNTGETKYDEELGATIPVQRKLTVADARSRGIPVVNAQTLIRKDDWLKIDRAVLAARRKRLKAWTDIPDTFRLDGMGVMVLEHERMTDPGEASVDMDVTAETTTDTHKFQLEGTPLPVTHSGFNFKMRQLAVARRGGTPLDVAGAEASTRRVAESIEKTLIGEITGMTFSPNSALYDNTPTVYGYTNHPDRITYTSVTTPTGVGTSDDTLADVLAMIELALAQNFYGPFVLYHTTDFTQYMNNDYLQGAIAAGLAAPTMTLRQRLMQIDDITAIRRLDHWTDTASLLLVQMTSDVVRKLIGMDFTTMQWEEAGGLVSHFKVMAIHVPQIRSQHINQDQTNAAAKCGIVHGTTS